MLHASLDVLVAALVNPVQAVHVAHHHFYAELNVGVVFQIQQHHLAGVVQHHQVHVDDSEDLQLSFRKHVFMLLQVIMQKTQVLLVSCGHRVCNLYQQDVLLSDLHEKEGTFGREEEKLLPEHPFVDLYHSWRTVYCTDLK